VPRIRTIKPSFFRSDDVSALPLRARLTWVGLWTQCDDQGRTKDHARLIKADIWPLDNVSLADIEEDLETLAEHGRIVRYEVDGQRYLEIVNWHDHQTIQKPTRSKIPAPPDGTTEPLPETYGSPTSRKGREGKGRDAHAREPPPPRTCPKHPNGTEDPCRACGTARLAAESWAVDQRKRITSSPNCRTHRGQPAHNCSGCLADEKAAGAA
jgi:hypothetical protein